MALTVPSASFASLNTNLSALVTKSAAAASLANLALVTPTSTGPSYTKGYQPNSALNAKGQLNLELPQPEALLFHYEGENRVSLTSDITDHYVEDNTTIVDQIGLRPETVTVTGYIGEVNNVLPTALQILQQMNNNLTALGVYSPQLSVSAQIAYNQAVFAYQAAKSLENSAIAAWTSLTGAEGAESVAGSGIFTAGAQATQNKQQKMFQQFYGYWANRVLFDVQTPWAIFTNMAIQSISAVQSEDTRTISSFDVTFKKIRVAATQISAAQITQGKAYTQSSPKVNLGSTQGNSGFSLLNAITPSIAPGGF